MKIGSINLAGLNRPFLIAEGGATHQGDPELALKMTAAAVESGADAVTFQEIDENRLYTDLPELPVPPQPRVGWECLKACRELAKSAGLCFSVCVTDPESLRHALEINIDFVKIVSYDITFFPFLKECALTGLPILLSTGASTFSEIEKALAVMGAPDRTLLYHTDCGYPTTDGEVNLQRMVRLRERFSLPVGYCDHTSHGLSCMAATALKASVIEKHFILDRTLGGSDHMVALEPDEITQLFSDIKAIANILGNGADEIAPGDFYRRNHLRRSIALAQDLPRNCEIREEHLTMLRPPGGLSWDERYNVLGKKTRRAFPCRHILKPEDVE
jgi:sialic acid synthase SpsE